MLKQFYEKVLPSQGVYCISGIDKNKNITNRFVKTLDELTTTVAALKSCEQNVFVAPGSFVGHSRRAEASAFLRSFFVDLDVGKGKEYTSKEDANDALDYLLEQTHLPVPVRVDSGGGMHAYWIFDEDVPSVTWKPYAEKLKALIIGHIPIDPVVTADVARIMRCPETDNYKYNPPSPTLVVGDTIPTYPFSEFTRLLGEVPDSVASILSATSKGIDEDTAKILEHENMEYVFATIAINSLDGSGCNQIKHILSNSHELPEPMWRAGLSVARRCIDWESAIHMMSEDYAGYSPEETLKKANETLNAKWAYSCIKFNGLNPGGCEGCGHRGKIPSPTHIGKQLKEVPPSEEDSVWEQEDTEEVLSLTKLPDGMRPYQRGVNGGIYLVPSSKQDKSGNWHQDEPILICEHDLFPLKRMYGPEGESLFMRHILPHDDVRDFILPMKFAYSREKFQETLSRAAVFPPNSRVPLLMEYIIKWGNFMVNSKSAEMQRSQMGWTEDNDGFVIGEIELRRTGNTVRTPPSPLVHSISKMLGTKGTYENWRAAADKLNIPDMEIYLFPIFMGLGSPLMRFTNTRGVSMCYVADTGVGKTGALYAGLSLFGDPGELSLSGKKEDIATGNALTQYYMGLKNLLMGLDEASNYPSEDLSDLVHKISSGKNKLRMQSSQNTIREIEQTASGITMFTSNQSLVDKLLTHKKFADGELARIIELTIKKGKPLEDFPELGQEIFDAFRTNYGHAGPIYIKYLFEKGEDYIADKIAKWTQRAIESLGNNTAYRFHFNLLGVSFAGAELGKEAGVFDPDIEQVFTAIISHILCERLSSVKLNSKDYEGVLGDFQNLHAQNGTLVVNEDRVVHEPRGAVVARVEINNQMYYISKTELKKYLSAFQISLSEFTKTMESKKLLVYQGKYRMLKGWGHANGIAVMGFPYEASEEMFKPNVT